MLSCVKPKGGVAFLFYLSSSFCVSVFDFKKKGKGENKRKLASKGGEQECEARDKSTSIDRLIDSLID